ncbi:MAG TPA: GDSL-type esterase/lipase family protein [Anaerolineae bacterium]|nr:GDSL-type esterase/lipase family protein [Anaerolineae bacterium]
MALLYTRRMSRPFWQNLVLSALSLFITLMVLEFYFKVFFAQPDAFGTLAMQNWYNQYYTGTFNALGYRDQEWTPEKLAGKLKVVVVGDSLVEGVGIERPEDRFSDLLGQKLGPKYAVLNVGRQGANTGDEIKLLLDYPYKPDILVWTYFINDIGDQAGPFGILLPPPRETPPLLSPLLQNSYAFNFIYWRAVRLFEARNFPDAKWQWLVTIYNHPDAWWAHQQQLLSIYEGTRSEQIPLLVVVFPGIPYLEESQFVTERVVNLYRDQDVPTLDVAELIKDIPVKERMASPVDQHPNELVHRLVAEALYDMFLDLDLAERSAQAQ